jgi:hypothetical protein
MYESQMLSPLSSQEATTPEQLFTVIVESPRSDLLKKLTGLPPSKSAEILRWFMERFELAGEALMDFANDVHLLYDQHLKKHEVIAQIMATPEYSRAIGMPAEIARTNLKDKEKQDKKIRVVWGDNWAREAEPCMLGILLLGVADFVQILVLNRCR